MKAIRSTEVTATPDGYRLSGTVEIHGKSRPQSVEVRLEDRGDTWAVSAQAVLTQTDFGVKPYSLLLGAVRVADQVTIDFTATRAK